MENSKTLGMADLHNLISLIAERNTSEEVLLQFRNSKLLGLIKHDGVLLNRGEISRALTSSTDPGLFSNTPAEKTIYPRTPNFRDMGMIADPGNKNNFYYPIETTAPAAELVAEGDSGGTEPEYQDYKEVKAFSAVVPVEMKHRFFMSVTPVKSQMLIQRLLNAMDELYTKIAFAGNGTTEPEGILNNADVYTETGASVSKAKLDTLELKVDQGGAPMEGRFYIVNPLDAKVLKNRPIVSGGDKMLMAENKINGQPALVSTLVDSGNLFYGHFSSVMISTFGELELFAKKKERNGNVIWSLFDEFDIVVRRPDWIAYLTNVD